jgi:hypothetical protein
MLADTMLADTALADTVPAYTVLANGVFSHRSLAVYGRAFGSPGRRQITPH